MAASIPDRESAVSPVDHASPLIFSVVSGKGGVGKTLLVSNIASCIASGDKTVLVIDLDFDNQGLTSLIKTHFDVPDISRSWFPATEETPPEFRLVRLKDWLFFLPATATGKDKEHFRSPDIGDRFSKILKALRNRLRGTVDIILLDCHGSSDPLTRVAVRESDRIILLTEPDPISFGGSLEWLLEIREQEPSAIEGDRVLLVANRVLPQFRTNRLRDRLSDAFAPVVELSTRDDYNVFCIPSEASVNDLFGKVPFVYDVSKGSIFRKKVELLVYNLLTNCERSDLVPTNILRRFRRNWRRRLVFNRIDTREDFVKRNWLLIGVISGVIFSIFGVNLALDNLVFGTSELAPFPSLFILLGNLFENNILLILIGGIIYFYFAAIWNSVFMLYVDKIRTGLAVRRSSTGPVKVWSGLSVALDSFIAIWIFPIAVFVTLATIAMFAIFPLSFFLDF